MKTFEENEQLNDFANLTVKSIVAACDKLGWKINDTVEVSYHEEDEYFHVQVDSESFDVNVHMDSVETAEKELLREVFKFFAN